MTVVSSGKYSLRSFFTEFSIEEILVLALSFCFTFFRLIPAYLTVGLVIAWVFTGNWKEKYLNLKNSFIILLPALLYLNYCAGMIYTENVEGGLSDLTTKLSLLVLPLVFASSTRIRQELLPMVMDVFVAGCCISILVCIAHSCWSYYDEIQQVKIGLLHDTYTNTEFFFASKLSYFLHPSYFAMSLCISMAWIFYRIPVVTATLTDLLKPVLLNLIISIFIFFLASKIGILVTLLIWLVFLIWLVAKKKWYLYGVIFFILGISGVTLLVKNSKIITSRFEYAIHALTTPPDVRSAESSEVRLLIWKVDRELIAERPLFGYGTGDIHEALDKKYEQYGMTGALEHHLNAHNQFFQTGIALGTPGMLLLIAALLFPMLRSIKQKRYFILIFLLLFVINIAVESMLETEAGVIFYSFFNSLLLFTFDRKK